MSTVREMLEKLVPDGVWGESLLGYRQRVIDALAEGAQVDCYSNGKEYLILRPINQKVKVREIVDTLRNHENKYSHEINALVSRIERFGVEDGE